MLDESPQSQRDRRAFQRHTGKAAAILYRESDVMRTGIDGSLLDISADGIGIIVNTFPEKAEQIKVLLLNEIQRVKREVRGVVRHSTRRSDGKYHVGVALSVRLTPLEVSQLKMSVPDSDSGAETWV